jgi:hypothetical protein
MLKTIVFLQFNKKIKIYYLFSYNKTYEKSKYHKLFRINYLNKKNMKYLQKLLSYLFFQFLIHKHPHFFSFD